MSNKWLLRTFSIIIIIFGLVIGMTFQTLGYCIGDKIFQAIGIPAWSNNTHYPGIIGLLIILIGGTMLNLSISKKSRIWVWPIVILAILAVFFFL